MHGAAQTPDPRIRPFLRDWVAGVEAAGDGRASLIENPVNLGFIGAVNLGLARAQQQAPDAPVVLLNSDAFVPEAWLSRLVAPSTLRVAMLCRRASR